MIYDLCTYIVLHEHSGSEAIGWGGGGGGGGD